MVGPREQVARLELSRKMPTFDNIDRGLLARRQAEFDKVTGPRVGDFIRRADGRLQRFTHDHGKFGLQTTCGDLSAVNAETYGCSFYFSAKGFCDFSGGLDPCVLREALVDSGETRQGSVWIFHHDDHKGSNGVGCQAVFRVYDEVLTTG